MTDSIQGFLFQNTCVQGKIVRLDRTLKTLLSRHAYPLEIQKLLSQTLCATTLLSAILKYEGHMTVQFQSKGPLTMLVSKCDQDFKVRGTARFDDKCDPKELLNDFEKGQLVITIQNTKTSQRYQSIVNINHQSISESLENYFQQSEQLDTRFWLTYDDKTQQAAGLLLQKLPSEQQAFDKEDADNQWQHVETLAATITDEELITLDNETLLTRLFHESSIELYKPQPVTFHCPCNIQKMRNAILMLGEEEAMSILSTNRVIDVTCEYCNKQFEFDKNDVMDLFRKH